MKKISIIVPIYNEEDIIKDFHASLIKEILKISDYKISIKYILDKSTDNTKLILQKIASSCDKTIIVCLSSRFGHQQSLMAGIDLSLDDDAIIMMDGDLQHPPALIQDLLKEFENGHDIVNTIRLDYNKFNIVKTLFSKFFYWFFKLMTNQKINSSSADYRLISQKISKIISNNFKEKNIFIRGIISFIGYKQTFIKYFPDDRKKGNTKYSFIRSVIFAIQSIVAFGARPLYFFFIIGIAIMLLSLIFIMLLLVQYFVGSVAPPGWYTVVLLLFFFSGLNLLFMSIIGIYIGSTYEEIKKRPTYLIEEIIKKN